jgi:uncharacterized protein YneF (UPF0154 family)
MGTIILGLNILISILLLIFVISIAVLFFCFVGFFLQRNEINESNKSNVNSSRDD